MRIQLLGASVNAAVMAYHLAEIGHQVYWETADSSLDQLLLDRAILFNDIDLSNGLYAHLASSQLQLTRKVPPHTPVTVVALTSQQYQHFLDDRYALCRSEVKLLINYSHLGLGKTQTLKMICPDAALAYIPDFIREGHLINSFVRTSLIVGCEHNEAIQLFIQELFRPLFPLSTQYHFMSIAAAEFTKLSISGFLATKISFMNDLSNAAENLCIDIEEVRIAMSTDSRVGGEYLYPGCGFGGGNLTRDILTLKEVVQAAGNHNGLLDKIWDINEYQKEIVFRKLWQLFDGQLQGKVIAFWGAAFKPNTTSLAQAPICRILEACWAQGAATRVHDPQALVNLQTLYPDQTLLTCCSEQYTTAQNADALCLITEWKQYWSPDFIQLKQVMHQHHLIDGRNIYNPVYVEQQGFNYIGIGR